MLSPPHGFLAQRLSASLQSHPETVSINDHMPMPCFGDHHAAIFLSQNAIVPEGMQGPKQSISDCEPVGLFFGSQSVADWHGKGRCGWAVSRSRFTRALGHLVWRNEIANLAQHIQFGAGWFDGFRFHPCLAAGSKPPTKTFPISRGMTGEAGKRPEGIVRNA